MKLLYISNVDILLNAYLTSALDGREPLAWRSGCFAFWKRFLVSVESVILWDPSRSGYSGVGKNLLPLPVVKLLFLIRQPHILDTIVTELSLLQLMMRLL